MAAGSAAERAEAKGRASARKRGQEACLPVSHFVFCLAFVHKVGLLPVHTVVCAYSHIW